MPRITHYVRIKEGQGQNYYIGKHHITSSEFKGVDENTASYLRHKDHMEVITKNQYNKQHGIDQEKEETNEDE